jgi:hypothetical protein
LCPTGRNSRRSDFFDPPIAHLNAIVLIALKRPYTFVVLGILIVIFGGLTTCNLHRAVSDGLDTYLSVSVAQVQALAAELVEVQLRVRQVQASVSPIRALGGDWSACDCCRRIKLSDRSSSLLTESRDGPQPCWRVWLNLIFQPR